MANTIDLFNSGKLITNNVVGEGKVFKSETELTEFNKKQERFISNIDYSLPNNFARFGSAEEYYKNCIKFINNDYPYDSSNEEQLNWINNLNEFEFYVYKNIYPRYSGYLNLTSSQNLKIFPPFSSALSLDAKNTFNTLHKHISSGSFNLSTGFTFEAWLKPHNETGTTTLLKIYNVSSSSSGLSNNTLFDTFFSSSAFRVSASSQVFSFNYPVTSSEWHHYAIAINTGSMKLYVDGELKEEKTGLSIYENSSSYKFSYVGLLSSSLFTSLTSTGSYTVQPFVTFGTGNLISVDELRLWNSYRSPDDIGKNWFIPVHGNNFDSTFDDKLIFYYKFNEGTSVNNDICYDYSGYKNYALINNFDAYACRVSGSAINDSGFVQDIEIGDPIIESSIENSGTLNNFYTAMVASGSEYDITNNNLLYKKFPSWILQGEEENEIKHLKQVIQIVSSYFDDLYNKITELSNYKHIKQTSDYDKIYPFYDKILSSTGFKIKDLFDNFNVLEKIASRSETNIFDQDVQKVKNAIFQNIYNNLNYILKSKGTEKSLKSFLRSYGVDENLVRINLYADNYAYDVKDNYREAVVKKKTLSLTGSSNIFLSGTAYQMPSDYPRFTLESAVMFPNSFEVNAPATSSIMGFYISTITDYSPIGGRLQAYVSVENHSDGYKFYFRTGSATGGVIASSSAIHNLYDNSLWNISIALGEKATVTGSEEFGKTELRLLFRAFNTTNQTNSFISGVLDFNAESTFFTPYGRYFIGANNYLLTGSNVYETNAKYVYCNFWDKFLNDNEIIAHNKDVLNYGVE